MEEARVECETGQYGQGGEEGDEWALGPAEEVVVLGERQDLARGGIFR